MDAEKMTVVEETPAARLTKHKSQWGSETLSEKRLFVHELAGMKKNKIPITLLWFWLGIPIIVIMNHFATPQMQSKSPLQFSKSTETLICVRWSDGSFQLLGYFDRLKNSPALWPAVLLKEEDKTAFCSAAFLNKASRAARLLSTFCRYPQEENLVMWTEANVNSATDESLVSCITSFEIDIEENSVDNDVSRGRTTQVELETDHLTAILLAVLETWLFVCLTIKLVVFIPLIITLTLRAARNLFLSISNVEKAVQPHTDYSTRHYNSVALNDVETEYDLSNDSYYSDSDLRYCPRTYCRLSCTPRDIEIECFLDNSISTIDAGIGQIYPHNQELSLVHHKAIRCTEIKTASYCSGCSNTTSTSSTTSTSEEENPQMRTRERTEDSPTPVFSRKWEHSSIFSHHGGRLRKPGSDVYLDIPTQGALDTGTVVEIHTAVCADVEEMLAVLEVDDGAQIASPLAEYWVGENFAFNSDVIVSLPHFLPADFDIDGVHVYCITSDYDGHKHDSSPCSQGLDTEKAPLIALKLPAVRVHEVRSFTLVGDAVQIFTSHFCGFVCVYCDKKTDKEPKRPKLYMAAGGNISTFGEVQHVDICAYVWDERLKVADCRQKQGIDGITSASLGQVALLEKLRDTQIRLFLKLDDDMKSVLMHRIQTNGQPAFPFEQWIEIPFLSCKKCTNKGKLSPQKVQWALKSQPERPHIPSLEFAVEVTHAAKDQDDLKATTPLLIKLTCKDDERMEQHTSKPQPRWKTFLAKSRGNRPMDRSLLSRVDKTESPGEASGSTHDNGWQLPPVQQRSDEEGTLSGLAGTTACERRIRSFPLLNSDRLLGASSTSLEFEGAVGGVDVNLQLAPLLSEQRLLLTASDLREILEAERRAEAHRQRMEREAVVQALARRAGRAESQIKVLQWQLGQLSFFQQGFQDADNPSDIARPSECSEHNRKPLSTRTASTEPVLHITNPSLATTSETHSDDSFHSCCSCGDDFSPECFMDNLK